MFLVAVMVISCTPYVELCEADHPHRQEVAFTYQWNQGYLQMDSMAVLMERTINTLKMGMQWNSRTVTGSSKTYGKLLYVMDHDGYCELDSDAVCSRHLEASGDTCPFCRMDTTLNEQRIYAKSGEYKVVSVPWNKSSKGILKEYGTNMDFSLDSIFYDYDVSDSIPAKYSFMPDYNAYCGWIESESILPVYKAESNITIGEYAEPSDAVKTIKLIPSSVSQTVNIEFGITLASLNITVDSVVCQLSGMPSKINMYNRHVKVDKTYKSAFSTKVKSSSSTNMLVTSTLHVPGVVRNSSSTAMNGPGILNASIFMHYYDEDGTRHERRMDAVINLYRQLSTTPSLQFDSNGGIEQAAETVTLRIDSNIKLSTTGIGSVEGSLDKWYNGADIYKE